jgi:hypothetical protein
MLKMIFLGIFTLNIKINLFEIVKNNNILIITII